MNNPILRSSVQRKESYPIKICCVVENLTSNNINIERIREYSNSLNIEFKIREYDPRTYSDDRIFIESLPGFHIYEKNIYKNTIHNSTKINQVVEGLIDDYKKRQSIKDKNKQKWRIFFGRII